MDKKNKKIFVTQNIAEPMWSSYIAEKKRVTINPEIYEDFTKFVDEVKNPETTVVNIIDNKALLNEINSRCGLNLELNKSGLKAEISDKDNCHIIYSVSVTNLRELYKFEDKEKLPDGVNLRIIRYEIW